jgi:hypothetical protein
VLSGRVAASRSIGSVRAALASDPAVRRTTVAAVLNGASNRSKQAATPPPPRIVTGALKRVTAPGAPQGWAVTGFGNERSPARASMSACSATGSANAPMAQVQLRSRSRTPAVANCSMPADDTRTQSAAVASAAARRPGGSHGASHTRASARLSAATGTPPPATIAAVIDALLPGPIATCGGVTIPATVTGLGWCSPVYRP